MSRIRSMVTKLASLALIYALTLALLPSAYADEGGGSSDSAAPIGKVAISGSSYFEVKNVNLLSDQSGRIVAFTVGIVNGGSKDLSFIDYWVRVMTKSGTQFTARILPQDKDKNVVAAGSSQDISFYANVNTATELQDLKFRFIQWDFSQDNFERTIGEVSVPDGFSSVIPAGGSRTVKMNATSVKLSVKKFVSGKNEKYYTPTVYFTLENTDNHSITVPAYLFSIRTSEGYMYPLEAKGLKDLSINPQESKEITLSGSVPVSVSKDGWQLVITQNLSDLKINIPIAFFQLPEVTHQDGAEAGKEVQFTDANGLYTVQLNGIYRLPWEDQDIITADLTLSNKGTDSLPVPNLTGYFLLDGAVKVDAKIVQPSKVIGLGSGVSIGVQVAAKIPYTYDFAKLKLVLQEQEPGSGSGDTGNTGKVTDLLEFETPSKTMSVPMVNQHDAFTLTDPGYRSKFSVQSVSTYSSKSSDIFTAQVTVENQEKRFTNVSKLVANFRSADGTVFPAAIQEVKDKVSPGGKALLLVWSQLPKGYSTEGMNLLIGEAVKDGKLAVGEDKPDSYIKPFAFWLPKENTEVKTVLKDVYLAPYKISLDHIGTSIENSQTTLKFNYEIVKDGLVALNPDGHKVVISFEDDQGNKTFERVYDLAKFEKLDTDGSKDLKLGKQENFKIIETDPDLIYRVSFLKGFTLSIYDEFQGQRKLLASQKIDWFITTD